MKGWSRGGDAYDGRTLYQDSDFAGCDYKAPPMSYWKLSKVHATPWMRKLPMLALCVISACMTSFDACRSIFMVDRATWKMYRMSIENGMGFVWEIIILSWWPKWEWPPLLGRHGYFNQFHPINWRFVNIDARTRSLMERLDVYKQRGGTAAERRHASNLLERTMLRASANLQAERDKMLIMYTHKMHTIRSLQMWADNILGDTDNDAMEPTVTFGFDKIEEVYQEIEFIKKRMVCLNSQLAFPNGPRCFKSDTIIRNVWKDVVRALNMYTRAYQRAVDLGPPITEESIILINSVLDFPFNIKERGLMGRNFTSRSNEGEDLKNWIETRVDSEMSRALFPEDTEEETHTEDLSNGEIVAKYISLRYNVNLQFRDVGGEGECLYNTFEEIFGMTSKHWRSALTGKLEYGIWGTHEEIITMSLNMNCAIQVHAVDIYTLEYNEALSQRFTPNFEDDATLKTVHIINWIVNGKQVAKGLHFDPLIEISSPTPKPHTSVVGDFGAEFFYNDMNGDRQGPFPSDTIEIWFEEGYMQSDMSLFRSTDGSEVKVESVIMSCLFYYMNNKNIQQGPFTKEHIKKWFVEGFMKSDMSLFVAADDRKTTVEEVLANREILKWDMYTHPTQGYTWWWCEEKERVLFSDPTRLRMNVAMRIYARADEPCLSERKKKQRLRKPKAAFEPGDCPRDPASS